MEILKKALEHKNVRFTGNPSLFFADEWYLEIWSDEQSEEYWDINSDSDVEIDIELIESLSSILGKKREKKLYMEKYYEHLSKVLWVKTTGELALLKSNSRDINFFKWLTLWTPSKVSNILSSKNTLKNWWRREFHWWRSTNYFKKGISINLKWADLYRGNKFRKLKEGSYAPPFIWSETSQRLLMEAKIWAYIQEVNLQINWEFAPTIMPISVTELKKWIDWSNYIETIKSIIKEDDNSLTNIFQFSKSFFSMDEVKGFWSFDKLIEEILKKWPHGNMIYANFWVSTRVADILKFKWWLDLNLIFKNDNKEEIVSNFIHNIMYYHGLLHGLGLSYRFGSDCLLVDTTINWVSLDIWEILLDDIWSINGEWFLSRFIEIYGLCGEFSEIIWLNFKDFKLIFEKKVMEVYNSMLLKWLEFTNRDIWGFSLKETMDFIIWDWYEKKLQREFASASLRDVS